MSSAKGKLARLLGKWILRRAVVTAAEEIGGFRRLALASNATPPLPGAKVQLLLPSDDTRTYTPIAAPDGFVLLGWRNASGPGARWMSEVNVGDEFGFIGPQRSLDLPAGPVILVGDETSVAVAASFEAERPGQVRAVFAARDAADVQAAAARVGLHPVVVDRGATEPLIETVVSARAAAPGATIALTGGSELILALRGELRQRGIRNIKTKTYWVPGKSGLD